jgi:hypothetical protein
VATGSSLTTVISSSPINIVNSPFTPVSFRLFVLAASGLCSFAFGQSARTTPVGFLEVSLPAGTVEAPSRTSFHAALQEIPSVPAGSVTGRLTGATADSISDSFAGWTPGSLSNKSSPYFIRIVSGTAQGTIWQISTSPSVPNTATTVTVLNQGIDLTTLGIVPGVDRYEIFPADTLTSMFGASTLLAGSSAAVADNVQVWNGAVWIVYYFNSDRSQWERANAPVADYGDTVLRPDVGLIIFRRGPAMTFLMSGRLAPSDVQIRYANGGNTYGGGFPVTQTFAEARIQELAGWKQNANHLEADLVQIWNGAAWISYYFNPASSPPQWQRVGPNTPSDSVNVFVPGRPVMFVKRGTTPGSSFLVQARPYPD